MNLTLAEVAEAVGAEQPSDPLSSERVTGMTWDSRSVTPGDLYVAFVGERADGHDFVDAAVDAGAAAVLASKPVDAAIPVFMVNDTSRAVADLAAYWRKCLTSTVIGLTGSSGKTTTKNLVRDVLARELNVVATKANQNNELGVPATLLAADADTQMIVVEMGMRGLGQIAELAKIAQPNWGLVTNVGTSHVELLGSREAIAQAKAELYEALPEGHGLAFVNADDDFAQQMRASARLEERGVGVVYYSGSGGDRAVQAAAGRGVSFPFVWASDIHLDEFARPTFMMNAIGFEQLELPNANGSLRCSLDMRGLHNVSNACAAAAVGLAAGMSLESCCAALEAAQPEAGRQRVLRSAAGVTVVDDAYNANPDSMAASLATFSALDVQGCKVAVLGDMLELGDYASESHRHVGTLAAGSGVQLLVCVGPLSRLTAEAAKDAGMDDSAVITCDNAESALDAVACRLGEGDAVLVKASHSIGLERVVEGLVD